jgi:hypothetical protein
MDQRQSQSGGQQFGNYGHPLSRILEGQTVKQATDAVVIIRGTDGTPQMWATGEPEQANSLLREVGQKVGFKEFERA